MMTRGSTWGRLAGLACLAAACAGAPVESAPPEPPSPRASGARPATGSARPAASTTIAEPLVIPRAALDRALAAGPGRLLADVPLEPVLGPGRRFEGFRIVELFRGDARVQRFGVRPGDVVHAINGQRIVTPGDLMKVFDKLRGADSLEITLQRDGTVRTLRFPVEPKAVPAAPIDPEPAAAAPTATSDPGR